MTPFNARAALIPFKLHLLLIHFSGFGFQFPPASLSRARGLNFKHIKQFNDGGQIMANLPPSATFCHFS